MAAAFVAVDWGTTSARAYLASAEGQVLERRAAPLGITQVRESGFDAALAKLLGDWGALPLPRLASGMIGSRQGWVEAPYLDCPASLDMLAQGLVATPGRELMIVPGLVTQDAHGVPDVMRGEETQIAGVVGPGEGPLIVVLPGTHSKWAVVERGRVVTFRSYMTGELYAALLDHTILGALAARNAAAPAGTFERGLARAQGDPGLAHLVFAARTLPLRGELAAEGVPDYLSGVLIGSEIESARAWAAGHDAGGVPLRVVGDEALVTRYLAAFRHLGVPAVAAPSDAAVRGLASIANRAKLVA